MIADRLKHPLKRSDRVCPLGKNQEYACHYDWKIDRASSVPSYRPVLHFLLSFIPGLRKLLQM